MSIAKLHAKLIALDAEIADTLAQRDSIADKIEARQIARTAIEGDIALAQADADALNPILEMLLTQEALGENVAEELEAARAAVTAAAKRVIGARSRRRQRSGRHQCVTHGPATDFRPEAVMVSAGRLNGAARKSGLVPH